MNKRLIVLLLFIPLMSACRLVKLGQFYLSENHLKPEYPSRTVAHDPSQIFTFKKGDLSIQNQIGEIIYTPGGKKAKPTALDTYLDQDTKTTAFLVIRKDTILFEKYYDKFHENSLLPSFSVAKSFTSALMGIAIQEGYIQDENELVVSYLPELKEAHPYWRLMTIRHLLNMQSGIDFNEDSYVNPYSGIASLYITKDILKFAKKAKFKYLPGKKYYYSSLDTNLLGLMIERATKTNLADYLSTKIWKPCGMESSGFWSMDSNKTQNTKAFCCLNITARDYAKFGRLFMHHGNWNGQQIINEDWVLQSIQPDYSNDCYQYQWYSVDKGSVGTQEANGSFETTYFPDSLSAATAIKDSFSQGVSPSQRYKGKWYINKCGPEFYALGIFGQQLYVNPEKEFIMIRLGEKWDVSSRRIFNLIEKTLEGKEHS